MPDDPEVLIRSLGKDPEVDLERLDAARRRWPDLEPIALWRAMALGALGRDDRSEAELARFVDVHPEATEARLQLAESLLQSGQTGRLRALFSDGGATLATAARVRVLWAVARSWLVDGDLVSGRSTLEGILATDPDSIDARLLLAEIERAEGKPEAALAWLDEAVARSPEGGEADWSRLVVATLAGEWGRVRESARRLEIEVEGEEGPIDEDWGACRVRLPEEDGTTSELGAVRTGPATAVVVQISPSALPQHFYDHVVIDPRTEEDGPEDEDGDPIPIFEVLAFSPSGFETLSVEGSDPGEESIDRVVEELEGLDCAVEVYRNEEDEPWFGILVAVPPSADRTRVEALLRSLLPAED